MKRLPIFITASFLIISFLISSFPISASAEDYPFVSYTAYWRISVDGGLSWSTVNVSPDVSQNGLIFKFPQNIGTNQVNRIQFYLINYSGSPNNQINFSGITSISGNVSFYSDNPSFDLSSVSISASNQFYQNAWVTDGSITFSNNGDFILEPSSFNSARLLFTITDFNFVGFVTPYIRFNSLSINEHDIVNEAVYQGKISDFEQSVNDVVVPMETAEQQVIDDINNMLDSVPYESVLPDMQSALEDFYTDHQEGSILYASYFTTLWTDSFISPLIAVISMLAILGFVFFGRAF